MSDGLVERLIQAEGKVRVFEMDDGSVIERSGGSVSWRNNNPGNLKFECAESADKTVRTRWTKDDALARAQRQYEGIVDLDQWGNAIFESYEAVWLQILRGYHLYSENGVLLTHSDPAVLVDRSLPPTQQHHPNNEEYDAMAKRFGLNEQEIQSFYN